MNVLRRATYSLLVLLAIAVGVYIYATIGRRETLGEGALNLSVELIGILITVWLIDVAIRAGEDRENAKIRRVAFDQLRLPLLHHLILLQNVFKASLRERPENLACTMKELFTDDFFDAIRALDFQQPAPIAPLGATSWAIYLSHESKKLQESLASVLDRYAIFLDSETIFALESLRGSGLLSFLDKVPACIQLDNHEGWRRKYTFFDSDLLGMMREHVDVFMRLTTRANQSLGAGQKIEVQNSLWRDIMAPAFASGRAS